MLYTVKEVSSLTNVTIKALHHYHKIGLLEPRKISEAGYRLYGTAELERLQHILFYKELDFPLETIKVLLETDADRWTILNRQEELLLARKRRLDQIIQTLQASKDSLAGGEPQSPGEMFTGFASEEEWEQALSEQREHVQAAYGFDILEGRSIDVPRMNEQAQEAAAFMEEMAAALRSGAKHDGEDVQRVIRTHLDYLNGHGHPVSAAEFAEQTRFFLQDEFHLRMLEGQQTGLAYYLAAAAASCAGE
ncbi:MerR family transcriptional regulator [Paenibacillus dendritiformis]|uniref:MerR family transcriptional regulator n=1 Tax=Paenibacillus dendritiformis TaxID=130049 RepID=UPI00143DC3D3|nr:MerR family transcriptional regulator [Paenibacillus dendritiformis]NKI24740.1 MerR family transcriptional regulator [Paenibacillus dendritiformis]NRG00588.1 MerR family transcriptional regulator [Paenibacillus dendritiformis]GIO71245.1 MerR family transcriptional regulator [Paenibacillus dendritiformis]